MNKSQNQPQTVSTALSQIASIDSYAIALLVLITSSRGNYKFCTQDIKKIGGQGS